LWNKGIITIIDVVVGRVERICKECSSPSYPECPKGEKEK
jgi:hypothetical protein